MDSSKSKLLILVGIDLLIFAACWILAYSLRFGLSIPSDDSLAAGTNYALQLKLLMPWVIVSHLVIFWAFDLYRGILRYAGSKELMAIAMAAGAQLVLWSAINLFLMTRSSLFEMPQRLVSGTETEVLRIPWIILIVYTFMANGAAAGIRFSKRFAQELSARPSSESAPATLIVGAGDVADTLLRDLRRAGAASVRPVCAVAENPARVGMRLHGVPIVGTLEKIGKVIEENQIAQVLVALDAATPESLRRVVTACEKAEVKFRIVPSLSAISEGRIETSLRDVDIEDLLGREPVKLELPVERNYLSGRTILITGAGGSIGSEIARQCARCGAARILLLGKGENSIFEGLHELRTQFPEVEATPLIADIRDSARMEHLFTTHRPEIVFHAAAHKHVPLMQDAPDEAVKNNILGTATVALLAEKHGAERFVLISSDKAVAPVSVMGMTKRIAEIMVLSLSRESRCQFAVVRFGNVMGSRGSVIPLFRRQIRAGGPVTLTSPDVTRFFMTIPEAVSLVLQAGSLGRNSALYLLDMGEPVRIQDLARNMITLSGLRPETDIKIEYIGLRPGERLHEELLTETEGAQKTEIDKIYSAEDPTRRPWNAIERDLQILEKLAASADGPAIAEYLKMIIEGVLPKEETAPPAAPAPQLDTTEADFDLPTDDAEPEFQIVPDSSPQATEMVAEGAPTVEEALKHQIEPEPEPEPEAAPDFHIVTDTSPAAAEMVAEGAPLVEEALKHQVELTPEPEVLEESSHEDDVPEELEQPRAFEESDLFQEPEPEEPAEEANFPVEPPVPDEEPADPPAQETPAAEIEQIQEKEEEPIMAQTTKTPGATLVLMRVSPGADAETFGMLIEQMTGAMLGADDKLVCIVDADSAGAVPAGIEKLDIGGRPQGAVIAEALRAHPAAEIAITLTSEVLLRPDALKVLAATFNADATTPLLYSNFAESRDGKVNEVAPHDHNGCPHERFEFGPVIAYRTAAIEAVGGIREDLRFAWEYDLHLKLMEKGAFKAVRENLYTHFLPSQKEGKGGAVYSPGMGPLGGFSYVFYPEDMEKEVTSVFEEALKRRGCWIDHEAAVVNHGKSDFEVMVTIVIPILNRVRFIRNAIEKVQQGTYDNFEIVVIDNGSTDGTVAVVEELAAADSRIRLIHGKGGSIASALNEGIRAARGKYIGQLDSDDQYAPNTLEKMVEYLESHPRCGLAISYYRLMDENGTPIEDIAPVTHSGYSCNQIIRRDGAGATRYFAKAVLEEFGLYDEEHYGNFGEDYDMVVKTGEKYEVGRVHDVLYYYRRHADNTDVTRDPAMKYHNKNRARQEALRRRREINEKLGKV